VLDSGANLTQVAQEVRERFPDVNVTALALFSTASDVEFTTQKGNVNVSIPSLLQIETEPNIDIGDNVTLSIVGILQGDQFAENPAARIIPTEMDVFTNAIVKNVSDYYYAVVLIPWERRIVDTNKISGELPLTMTNVSVNYSALNSYVGVKGLSLQSNETTEKVGNLSYVTEVNGDLVYVKDSMNDSGKMSSDLKGILGDNITVDYPVSTILVQFSSTNFSKEDIQKPTGGELTLYRAMVLGLGEKLIVAGIDYNIPSNTAFDTILLNDSYSVGKNASVELSIGTIGKRIVEMNLTRVTG
jgi:hypothetical protein